MAVIKESGSLFSTRKGEARLIKVEMFETTGENTLKKKEKKSIPQTGGMGNTGPLLCGRTPVELLSTLHFHCV